jgi:hypothetical protein
VQNLSSAEQKQKQLPFFLFVSLPEKSKDLFSSLSPPKAVHFHLISWPATPGAELEGSGGI